MDASHYVNSTLPNFLIPSVDLLNPPNRIWVYQQDNASPHTARVTKSFLREHDIPLLEWPAYSPDLSPIENVWARIRKKLADHPPTTPQDAASKNHDIWISFPEKYAQNLALSMPKRLRKTIERRGYRL